MLIPPYHSLGIDERGEGALALLPGPSGPGNPVLIHAKGLRASDAWTGTAFRASIECHCVNFGNSVTLDAPVSDRALAQMCDLLGPLPENFYVTRDVPGTGRGLAILPAFRIEAPDDLDNATATLRFRAGGYGIAVARTIAAAAQIFGDNALTHATTSPIGVVTTIAFDPVGKSMQIVSSDLGQDLVEPGEAEHFLLSVRQHATAVHSNFAHLVQSSSRRGLSIVLTLASGPGRLRWSADAVNSSTTFASPGFTQALTISGIH
jgi:hypothetical protein